MSPEHSCHFFHFLHTRACHLLLPILEAALRIALVPAAPLSSSSPAPTHALTKPPPPSLACSWRGEGEVIGHWEMMKGLLQGAVGILPTSSFGKNILPPSLPSCGRKQKTWRQKTQKHLLHVAGNCSPSPSLEHSVPSSTQRMNRPHLHLLSFLGRAMRLCSAVTIAAGAHAGNLPAGRPCRSFEEAASHARGPLGQRSLPIFDPPSPLIQGFDNRPAVG